MKLYKIFIKIRFIYRTFKSEFKKKTPKHINKAINELDPIDEFFQVVNYFEDGKHSTIKGKMILLKS